VLRYSLSLNKGVTVTADELHNTKDLNLNLHLNYSFTLHLYIFTAVLTHTLMIQYSQSGHDISDSHLSPEGNLDLKDTMTDRQMKTKFWKTHWFARELLFLHFSIIALCKHLSIKWQTSLYENQKLI